MFNKSHSGSRLLAEALRLHGVQIGAVINESLDSLPMLDIVERVVTRYYPDFSPLWTAPWPVELVARLCAATRAHLGAGHDRGAPWGWKLCETGFALPVIEALFPGARYIHLIRDGRDVAFCDHVAPELPFWRKIYFNTELIEDWDGRPMTHASYEQASHLYNARHWANSVEVGRSYGMMLRERYLEVRYELLCAAFEPTLREILRFIGLAPRPSAVAALLPRVHSRSVGKYRQAPARKRRRVELMIEPTLCAFGYAADPSGPD
jgi:hypothetical protein